MNEEFIAFIKQHHVLNLSVAHENKSWSASCFYAFLENGVFVFASDNDTRHMNYIAKNPFVSATIALETKQIGLIQGIQCEGVVRKVSKEGQKAYFQAFPYARAMSPKLWEIEIAFAKLTDNRFGFGKKLIWQRDTIS